MMIVVPFLLYNKYQGLSTLCAVLRYLQFLLTKAVIYGILIKASILQFHTNQDWYRESMVLKTEPKKGLDVKEQNQQR